MCIPANLSYLVDGTQFNNSNNFVLQFNYNQMLTDSRINIYCHIYKNNLSITSLSSIYNSSIWLERELSDFTNIFFKNATDTRRLLLDYFQEKQEMYTHISNEKSYSNSYYEVILNY